MQLKYITIHNISSLINFYNQDEFKKTNLIYGTNGSGKTTILELLQELDDHFNNTNAKDEKLNQFLYKRISKEAEEKYIYVDLDFDTSKNNFNYDAISNNMTQSENFWTPIKVFNEYYTRKTIGDNVSIDINCEGILIGETNKELAQAYKDLEEIKKQKKIKSKECEEAVNSSIKEYREITSSSGKVEPYLTVNTLLSNNCEYEMDPDLLEQRKKIGYDKPESNFSRLNADQARLALDIDETENLCSERIHFPDVNDEILELLKEYTNFYNQGLMLYLDKENSVCPFCQRAWPDADKVIEEYRHFLNSNAKYYRDKIKDIYEKVKNYKNQIDHLSQRNNEIYKQVSISAEKFDVDISEWKNLEFAHNIYADVLDTLAYKLNHIDESVSISKYMFELQRYHVEIINNNIEIISKIQKEIDAVSTRRKELNQQLLKHYAKKMWNDYSKLRSKFDNLEQILREKQEETKRLEKENPEQDQVRHVFNSLIEFIGLSEYFIDENRRLNISCNYKEYDIADESERVSSAQRKILSLCYFFAETLASASSYSDLRNYILLFDDPVDSTDYIFFHSIAALIEKSETILQKLLDHPIKFGQFFIFTHNPPLHDRLNASRWPEYSKSLKKSNGQTILTEAYKSINNYAEYIEVICYYYKYPETYSKSMIYVGHIMRRILEILANFETLGSSGVLDYLDITGYSKLSLLVNHLSHESFTKMLNPISTHEELQIACEELLTLIRARHPEQFQAISSLHQISLPH